MYDFTMSKINSLVALLEETAVTSPTFVEIKMMIQDELYIVQNNIQDPAVKEVVLDFHDTWRRLGSKGTISGFSTAVSDLKTILATLPSSDS